jgi:hypothetical protein
VFPPPRNRLPAAIWRRLHALPDGFVSVWTARDALPVGVAELAQTIYPAGRCEITEAELLAGCSEQEDRLATAHARWLKCSLGRNHPHARRLAAEVYA